MTLCCFRNRSVALGRAGSVLRHVANQLSSGQIQVSKFRIQEARVLFLGNDKFSLESLKALVDIVHSKDNLTVVTTTESNHVGKYAKKLELPHLVWTDFKSSKKEDVFHIGVVASFGHLIPNRIIQQCRCGILNVHGSLLPKYRGASPVQAAIINGDSKTGVSIMKIAPHRFDVGPILAADKVRIDPHVRSPELLQIMAVVGANLLKKVLQDERMLASALPQDGEGSLAPKLTPEMGRVRWDQMTATAVYNLFRGLSGFIKMYTYYMGRKIELSEFGMVGVSVASGDCEGSQKDLVKGTALHDTMSFRHFYLGDAVHLLPVSSLRSRMRYKPGQMFVDNNVLFVRCCQETWVHVKRIKVTTKWMSPADFQNGYLSKFPEPHIFTSEMNKETS